MTSPYLFSRPSECSPSRWAYERKILPKIIEDSRQKHVYDYGCAAGELRFVLQGADYFGFDVVDYEFEKKIEEGVRFSIDYDASMNGAYDYCVSSFVFEYVPEDQKVLKDIYECLEPGSVFWITVPSKLIQLYELPALIYFQFTGKRYYLSGAADEHFYTVHELLEKLQKAGFSNLQVLQSSGIFTTLLKTCMIYSRLVLRQITKFFIQSKPSSPRQFIFFKSIKEYQDHKALERGSFSDRFWEKVFSIAMFLDGLFDVSFLNSEFAIRAVK